jgi:crotonobetainyl-CoA:carnitine CoA-transferase CaiB-like acyl-CoA transferase
MTGWGQHGPLAHAAGHDLNYIALSGALWYAGQPGEPPLTPPSVVGDVGGGALYLTVGVLAGVMSARATGRGQVVDAAIVDGSAHMMNLLLSLKGAGEFVNERGASILDGPHWYSTYRCAGRPVHFGRFARAEILPAAVEQAGSRRGSRLRTTLRRTHLARTETTLSPGCSRSARVTSGARCSKGRTRASRRC